MFTKIASFAFAAVVLANIATPAHAGMTSNGPWPNGVEVNGVWPNGVWPNGVWPNGVWPNGVWPNGSRAHGTQHGTSGFAIDGIELPATIR